MSNDTSEQKPESIEDAVVRMDTESATLKASQEEMRLDEESMKELERLQGLRHDSEFDTRRKFDNPIEFQRYLAHKKESEKYWPPDPKGIMSQGEIVRFGDVDYVFMGVDGEHQGDALLRRVVLDGEGKVVDHLEEHIPMNALYEAIDNGREDESSEHEPKTVEPPATIEAVAKVEPGQTRLKSLSDLAGVLGNFPSAPVTDAPSAKENSENKTSPLEATKKETPEKPVEYKFRRIKQVRELPDRDGAIKILQSLAKDAKTKEERDEAVAALTEWDAPIVPEKKERVAAPIKEERETTKKPALHERVRSGEVDIKELPLGLVKKLAENKDEDISQLADLELARRDNEPHVEKLTVHKEETKKPERADGNKEEKGGVSRILNALDLGQEVPDTALQAGIAYKHTTAQEREKLQAELNKREEKRNEEKAERRMKRREDNLFDKDAVLRMEGEGGGLSVDQRKESVVPPSTDKKLEKERSGEKPQTYKKYLLEVIKNFKEGDTPPPWKTLKANLKNPEVAKFIKDHPELVPAPLTNREIERAVDADKNALKYPVAESPFEIKQGQKQNAPRALSPLGEEILAAVDAGGLPTSVNNRWKKALKESGITYHTSMTPEEAVEALRKVRRAKQEEATDNFDETNELARLEGEGGALAPEERGGEIPTLTDEVLPKSEDVPVPTERVNLEEEIRIARMRLATAKNVYGETSEEYKDAAGDLRAFEFAAISGETKALEGIIAVWRGEVVPSPKTPEEVTAMEATKAELEKMTGEEREVAGWNLANFGYKLEKLKNTGTAATYNWVASRFDEKGTLGRFFGALSTQFRERDREMDERMKGIEERKKSGKGSGWFSNLSNVGYFTGNILKYGRILSDIGGWSVMAPLRGVMLGSTMAASGLDAAKEARLENEAVKEKTRIEDIEKAATEAWGVYARAMQTKGLNPETDENTKVTKEELTQAYREQLPKDLLARLAQNPDWLIHGADGPGLVQKIFEIHITRAAKSLDRKLNNIDADAGLSVAEKERQKEALLLRFGRSKMLNDFDRMVSQQGLVDTLAMSSRYGSQAAKAVVYGMMAQSAYLLWDQFGEAFGSGAQDAKGKMNTLWEKAMAALGIHEGTTERPDVGQNKVAGNIVRTPEAAAPQPTDGTATYSDQVSRSIEHGNSVTYPDQISRSMEHGLSPQTGEEVATLPYTVKQGDNLTRIMKEHLGIMNDLTPFQQENVVQNFIKSLSEAEKAELGITGVDTIYAGKNIQIDRLNEILLHKEVGGENIITHAQHLGGGIVEVGPDAEEIPGAHPVEAPAEQEKTVTYPDQVSRSMEHGVVLENKTGNEVVAPVNAVKSGDNLPESVKALIRSQWDEIPDGMKYGASISEASRYLADDVHKIFGPDDVFGNPPKEWVMLQDQPAEKVLFAKEGEVIAASERDAIMKIRRYAEENKFASPRIDEPLDDFLVRAHQEKIFRDGPSRPLIVQSTKNV